MTVNTPHERDGRMNRPVGSGSGGGPRNRQGVIILHDDGTQEWVRCERIATAAPGGRPSQALAATVGEEFPRWLRPHPTVGQMWQVVDS